VIASQISVHLGATRLISARSSFRFGRHRHRHRLTNTDIMSNLLVGVAVGIALAVRLGVGRLLEGVTARQVLGMAGMAGIGFTVSIFVAALAFDEAALSERATIRVLAASALAACLGSTILLSGAWAWTAVARDGADRSLH
jgi:NhaA family Na+:H+ antiporter